jgi:hypothetical protein
MSIFASKRSSVISPNITYPKNSPLGNVGVCTTAVSKAYPVESYCVPQLMSQAGSLYNNSGQKTWGSSSSEYLRNTQTEVCCNKKTQQDQNSVDSSYMIEQRKRVASGSVPMNRTRSAVGISPDYQSSKDVSIWSSYTGGSATRKVLGTNRIVQ